MANKFFLFSVTLLLLAGVGCEEKTKPSGGMMEIKLNLAKKNKGIDRYIIAGAGPGKKVFYESNVKGTEFKRNLAPGKWKISIDGLDSKGKVAARGYGTVNIVEGKDVVAPIRIRRLKGYGKVIVKVDLSNNKLPVNAKLYGELWQIGRRPINIEFDSKNNSLSYNKYLRTGYYDIVVNIKRYKKNIGGAVRTIKIMNGGSTEVSVNIIEKKKIKFSVDSSPRFISTNRVTIVRDRNISVGESIQMHTVYSIKGEVVISWYINGRYFHNGNLFTLDKKLSHGTYRLDVSVFDLKSNRGASASTVIQVMQVNPHAKGFVYKCISLDKFLGETF